MHKGFSIPTARVCLLSEARVTVTDSSQGGPYCPTWGGPGFLLQLLLRVFWVHQLLSPWRPGAPGEWQPLCKGWGEQGGDPLFPVEAGFGVALCPGRSRGRGTASWLGAQETQSGVVGSRYCDWDGSAPSWAQSSPP